LGQFREENPTRYLTPKIPSYGQGVPADNNNWLMALWPITLSASLKVEGAIQLLGRVPEPQPRRFVHEPITHQLAQGTQGGIQAIDKG
jgi:hypothetical protein